MLRAHAMNPSAAGVPDTPRLEAALRNVLSGSGRRTVEVEVLAREANDYASTFPSEIVTCRVGDRPPTTIFCKYGPDESSWDDYHFLGGHRRGVHHESAVYREILGPLGVSSPHYFGAYETEGWTWLILEHIADAHYVKETRSAMSLAARWIGEFHARSEAFLATRPLGWLRRYDADYYQGWIEAAASLVSANSGEHSWIRDLRARATALVDLLEEAPAVIVHGEFYPSNVLYSHSRVCPVDWESAAIGPGELDVVSLTEGWDERDVCTYLGDYAMARWPTGTPSIWNDQLLAARILLQLRFLGDRGTWDHGGTWYIQRLDVLERDSRRLGLLA